jgi:xanthine dehydrogenase accessory factor
MESYHSVLDAMITTKQGVLATIIHVDGSAYQKEGACMFIEASGRTVGLLSGGCLEETVIAHAMDVMQTGQAQTITFDMKQEDDLSWGKGAGCNGVIHVLLQPLTPVICSYFLTAKAYLDRGEHVLYTRKLDEKLTEQERLLFLTETGNRFGGFHGEIPQQLANLANTVPFFHAENGIYTISGMPFYIQHYWPKPRLIIFGANPDVKPLISFAKQTGFSVTVTDWRPAFCCAEHLPEADERIVGFPHEVIPKLNLCDRDFVVVMTHQFDRDREIISFLREKPLYYLGILGPKQRTERLFSSLSPPPSLHSPAGLSIGARGPEEIAISIVAELIQVLRKKVKKR